MEGKGQRWEQVISSFELAFLALSARCHYLRRAVLEVILLPARCSSSYLAPHNIVNPDTYLGLIKEDV